MVNIFLPISFNSRFWCLKELSPRDGSFEYPQHMFWMRNKHKKYIHTLLSGGLFDAYILIIIITARGDQKVRGKNLLNHIAFIDCNENS